MRRYALGLYEKALPGGMGFPQMLRTARMSGYDFFEMSVDENDERLARLDWSDTAREALLRAVHAEQLPIRTLCLSGHRRYPLGSRSPETRRYAIEMLEKAVRLADDLGIRIIQLAGYDVYYEESNDDTCLHFTAALARCVEYAARHGILLGFETMETPFMDTVGKAMRYVRSLSSPYLGVYPDLGNLTNAAMRYGLDLRTDIGSGRGKLLAMHLKEARPGLYRDLRYGEGCVDFEQGIALARDAGVRMFVTEFWDDGRVAWGEGVRMACEKMRGVLDAVFEV